MGNFDRSTAPSTPALSMQWGGLPTRNSYLLRQIAGVEDAIKQAQRDLVREFILSHHVPGPIRMLTMPAANWSFESQFARMATEACHFIGVEKDETVFIHSRPRMLTPRSGHKRAEVRLPLAGGKQILGLSNDLATLLCVDVNDFLQISSRDCRAINRHRIFSCAWIEINGNLTTGFLNALKHLGNCCDRRLAQIPVAITFMEGREKPDITSALAAGFSRLDLVAGALEFGALHSFKLVSDTSYVSESGARMVQFFGLLEKRERATVDSKSA